MELLTVFKRREPAANEEQPIAEAQRDVAALNQAIRAIAKQASTLGREAAEVRGLMEDTREVSNRQAQALTGLGSQVQQITQAQKSIGSVSDKSAQAALRARQAVEEVGQEVARIVSTLRQVSKAADSITRIALQTRLVAFNASVEAKRAGVAGRGFGVVADAVKDLAAQVESSSKQIAGTVGELDARIDALSREIRTQDDGAESGAFHQALADVQSGVAKILAAAEQSVDVCGALDQRIAGEAQAHSAGSVLEQALTRSESFLTISEQLIELVSHCEIETEDTPFIEAAVAGAKRLSELLQAAVHAQEISLADLFDEHYLPIAHTNPKQYTTRFVGLADRLFPQVQEPMLELHAKVVFCIAVDRNGYVATHNKKYCYPQRGDLAWDTANSRYRRLFNDRAGLAAARNTQPFLLQTYRRDMGGGQFLVMKEAVAPITIAGRHWGGLRLAFQF